MVVLPPQTENANPCLKGSGPFASSICSKARPGLRCLRSATTSFWHSDAVRGPSTPTAAPTHLAEAFNKSLANGEPSTHGTSEMYARRQQSSSNRTLQKRTQSWFLILSRPPAPLQEIQVWRANAAEQLHTSCREPRITVAEVIRCDGGIFCTWRTCHCLCSGPVSGPNLRRASRISPLRACRLPI